MRIRVEMSDELVSIDGVLCRVWNGHAENGVPVRVYIHRVAVPLSEPLGDDWPLLEMPLPETEEQCNDISIYPLKN